MDLGPTQDDPERHRRRTQLLAELAVVRARRSRETPRWGPVPRPERVRGIVAQRRRSVG